MAGPAGEIILICAIAATVLFSHTCGLQQVNQGSVEEIPLAELDSISPSQNDLTDNGVPRMPRTCAPTRCEEPESPHFGYIEADQNTKGSSIRFRCQDGYHLIGSDTATCVEVEDSCVWDPPIISHCEESEYDDKDGEQPTAATDIEPTANSKDLPEDCQLPKKIGKCRGSIPRYYYDVEAKKCLGFRYGGCGGNANNFHTLEECEALCSKRR